MTDSADQKSPIEERIKIDFTREFLTRSGNRVVLDSLDFRNSTDNLVTFPVKGTVFNKDRPRKRHRSIWTLDGKARALGDHNDDIVDGFGIDQALIAEYAQQQDLEYEAADYPGQRERDRELVAHWKANKAARGVDDDTPDTEPERGGPRL